MLDIFIFDDVDSEISQYLGVAKVSLISLANDKPIKGTFELRKSSGEVNGSIDVWLKWRYTYLPASAKPRAPRQRLMAVPKDQDELERHPEPVILKETPIQPSSSIDNIQYKPPIGSSTPKQVESDTVVKQDKQVEKPLPTKRTKEIKEEKKIEKPPKPQPPQKAYEEMTMDELEEAVIAPKPKPLPRRRTSSFTIEPKVEEKPIEQMNIDEMIAATNEPVPTKKEEEHEFDQESGESEVDEEINEEIEEEESDETAQVAEEMRRTAERDSDDATFEEQQSDDRDSTLGDEMDIPLPEKPSQDEPEAGYQSETSGSEAGLVVTPSPSRTTSAIAAHSQTIIVQITSLTLEDDSPILLNKAINQLFVSYRFLDCEPADLETPMSLQKPKSSLRPIYYNFKKVFHVDAETNPVKRNCLKYMLTAESLTQGRIIFTVVSEPADPDEGDCMDVAYAFVDLLQILQTGKDVIDQDIDLNDLMNEQGVVGSLMVTVEAFEALRSLYDDEDDENDDDDDD